MSYPVTAAPSLETWQVAFGSTVIGGPGLQVGVTQIEGLGMPDVSSGDVQRPHDSGSLTGFDYLTSRTITVDLEVYPGETDTYELLQAIATATTTTPPFVSGVNLQTEQPLWVKVPTIGTVCAMAKCRQRAFPVDLAASLGVAKASLQFSASDPRLYSEPTTVAAASSISLTNGGNYETRAKYTVSGATASSWTLSAAVGGTTIGFITFSQPIPGGSTVVIDSLARSVFLESAGTNWRGVINPGASWWSIPAGETVTITVSSGTVSAVICDAWML